ncbi:DUF3775 domain-containing protein [Marinobacter sp. TBZ242]|uniref:DUF3775 domain-containing protein n=1 Tax=Marinobacter azerbaijanicus TaxID=3050455 RepID=A0ABT7IEU4_9GAMM|nr:DUF3775 domain-containing protein [Marinobacter sp. TBZ242]MDL0432655.1 DUF3775 domain-containing protein [Marinobacter sp. TBZ242]
MLNVNPDTVCRLIELAQAYHVREPANIPNEDNNTVDDWSQNMLDDHKDNTSYEEFETIIKDLEPDQQHEVVALLWLGRGDYSLEEWDSTVKLARQQWSPETAQYLIDHPLLADYLREGLELHGYECD